MAMTANSPKALRVLKAVLSIRTAIVKQEDASAFGLPGEKTAGWSHTLYLLTITGLTSMEPVVAEGMRAAMAIASSRSLASTRK